MLFRPKKNLKVVWITLKIQGNFFKCSDVKVSKDGNVELTRQWNGGGERLNLPSQSRLWTGMDMAGEADTSGRYSGLAGQVSCLRAPHWPRLHTSSHSPVGVGGQQAPCVNWPLRRRGSGRSSGFTHTWCPPCIPTQGGLACAPQAQVCYLLPGGISKEPKE